VTVRQWLDESDVVEQFIQDQCRFDPNAKIGKSMLYEAFHTWCCANGHKNVPTSKTFRSALADRGIVEDTSRAGGTRRYRGITLADDADVDDAEKQHPVGDAAMNAISFGCMFDDLDIPIRVQ